MVKFTINTTLKLFIAKAGITSFDVKEDLYSDAKEDWLAGGTVMGYDFPIRVIGGDPVGGGIFAGDLYFLRDGWKIRPDEADHTLSINGNLFLDEGETGELFVPTLGGFMVTAIINRSNLALGVETGGGGGASAAEVWTYSGGSGRQLSPAGNQAIVDELDAELYDGRSFANIMVDLLAMAAGRIVESPTGTFTFYERDNLVARYVLTRVGNERTRA